jgi:hypothetical protein
MLNISINTCTTLCHDCYAKCHHIESYHFQGTDFHTKVSFGTEFYWWDLVIHTEHMFCTCCQNLFFDFNHVFLLNIHFCTDPLPMAVPHQLVTFWFEDCTQLHKRSPNIKTGHSTHWHVLCVSIRNNYKPKVKFHYKLNMGFRFSPINYYIGAFWPLDKNIVDGHSTWHWLAGLSISFPLRD